jgi:predicted mannosyl-3-phosphoglycerate phosphatase (HAD superfamily)
MAKLPVILFLDGDTIPPVLRSGPHRVAGILETLAADRITIVLCAYRTRAEMEHLRQSLGVFHPFVCEGGAAAFVPERYFGSPIENARAVGGYEAIEFAPGYDATVDRLRRHADRQNVAVTGFNDMSVAQVAHECGQSLLDARLAKLREYSECFRLLRDNPLAEQRLITALRASGLDTRPAGPFLQTVAQNGFGPAVAVLSTLYRLTFGKIVTACLGSEPFETALASHVDAVIDDIEEVTCEHRMERALAEEHDQAALLQRAHHRGLESRALRARSAR